MINFTIKKPYSLTLFTFLFCLMTVSVFAQPANDNVADALPITVDAAATLVAPVGATAEAGEDALTPPNSANCAAHTWCDPDGITRSSWYSFVAPASGAVRVSICGSTFDSQLATYQVGDVNDFGTFTLLDASDDVPNGGPDGLDCGPGPNFSSWHDHGCLNAGETYYVVVDLWSNDAGVSDYAAGDMASVEISTLAMATALTIDSISIAAPACAGLANGSATVNFVGTYPWIIEWNTGADTETISDLTSGTYSVTITDFCGTSATSSIDIDDGPPPVVIELEDNFTFDPLCEGTGGQIQVLPITGIGPFTYAWSTGDTTATIRDLAPGEYTVTITDACGGDPTIETITFEENIGTGVDAGDDVELCESTVEIGPSNPMSASADLVGYNIGADPEGNVACRGGGFIAQNSYFRPFDLVGLGYDASDQLIINGVEFFYATNPAAGFDNFIPGVEVALHVADNIDLSVANMNEIDRVELTLEGTNDVTASYRVPLEGLAFGSDIIVVELTINAASTDGHTFDFRAVTSLPAGATLTYLTSTDCGIATPTATGDIGFPDDNLLVNMFVANNVPDFSYQWDNAANLDDATAQNPQASATGIYNVTITDNNCNITIEDQVEVVECGTMSVLDPAYHSFSINPNPSSGAFLMQNEGDGKNVQMKIHDLQGREVYSLNKSFGSGSTHDLNLNNLAGGLYILQMTYDSKTEVHRLVIQK